MGCETKKIKKKSETNIEELNLNGQKEKTERRNEKKTETFKTDVANTENLVVTTCTPFMHKVSLRIRTKYNEDDINNANRFFVFFFSKRNKF